MLHQVAEVMRRRSRLATLHHPNSMNAEVWRKKVVRTVGAGAETIGGLPTLGGLGVLDSEDEPQAEFEQVGSAKVLFTGQFDQAGATVHDGRMSVSQDEGGLQQQALIEPIDGSDLEPKDGDLVLCQPGGGVVLPYEITKVMTAVNVHPFAPKYELRWQGDVFDAALKVDWNEQRGI